MKLQMGPLLFQFEATASKRHYFCYKVIIAQKTKTKGTLKQLILELNY